MAAVEAGAERLLPGISDEYAWPTLRARLVLLAATGTDPLVALHGAANARELDTADDRAAVLDWRMPDLGLAGNGPLPWLPGIPNTVQKDPHWGPYLTERSGLVTTLEAEVRHQTNTPETPAWWQADRPLPTPDLLGDLAVWRAANSIPDTDRRPTGPTQRAKIHALWQHDLDDRLGHRNTATLADWTTLLHTLVPATRRDDFTPQLAEHLAQLANTGIDAHTLLRATAGAPLPDDHAASALWWRIQNHLPDAHDAGEPAPLEWPAADATTVPYRPNGPDEPNEPRPSAHHERRMTPVRHDRPRGPGLTR